MKIHHLFHEEEIEPPKYIGGKKVVLAWIEEAESGIEGEGLGLFRWVVKLEDGTKRYPAKNFLDKQKAMLEFERIIS